jgi:transposase
MIEPIVSDALWEAVAPLLPPEKARPKGGRKPIPARQALTGIIFVLRTGTPWEHLPREICGCSGMTCWRRLLAWKQAGVWDALHRALLDRLGRRNGIDFERAALDAQTYPAKRGARKRGRTPPTAAAQAPSAT